MKTRDWSEIVESDLRDQSFAAAYLQECLEDGVETFLVALRDVARANGGVAGVAKTVAMRRSVTRGDAETGATLDWLRTGPVPSACHWQPGSLK